jgi:hypothetical protein
MIAHLILAEVEGKGKPSRKEAEILIALAWQATIISKVAFLTNLPISSFNVGFLLWHQYNPK